MTTPEKDNKQPQSLTYFPSIIPDNDVKSEWMQEMSKCRTMIAVASPMLTYMAFRCRFRWTHDEMIQTAAAMPWNGENHLFFNPKFFMDDGLKSSEERAFVVLHEVLHIMLEHVGRATDQGYDRQLWNIATDYVINLTCAGAYKDENGDVKYAERYSKYLHVPKGCLFDERFIGMSSDEVYHLLLDENDQDAQKAIESVTGQPGEDGEGQQALDGVADVQPTKEEVGNNRRAASAGVATAEQQNGIGENEGNLVRTIAGMSKPVVCWEDELQEAVQHSTKERSTYSRLSRRQGLGGVVFPSQTGQRINGVFGFDSSGSMCESDYADVAGELSGILDSFEAWDLTVLSCDTKAYVIGEYSSDDDDDISTMTIEAKGLGGTILVPLVEYANDQLDEGEEINFCIIVTDGGFHESDLDPYFSDELKNIVVVTRGGNTNLQLENAKVIYMDDLA